MAKANAVRPRDDKYEDWRVDDAMHAMLRAREIVGDKKMMGLVKKRAKEHAKKMQGVADQASALAKRGLISDKQMAKLDKTKPLAKGSEGDKGGKATSQTQQGVVTR